MFSIRKTMSLIVVLAMMLTSVAVFALTASADDAVIGIDRVNNYDWTEKQYNSDSYVDTAVSAGEVLMATSADNTKKIADLIGGNYFTWWYAFLAEYDAEADAYVVTALDKPGDGDGLAYENWTTGEGKFIITCNTGYASLEASGNADDAAVIQTVAIGNLLTIEGAELADIQAQSGALTGVTVKVTVPVVEEESKNDNIADTNENLAAGKTYTTSEQFRQGGRDVNWGWDDNAPYAYPDEDGKTLTDGKIPADDADYLAVEWAGWTSKHPNYENVGYNWITVDLGESTELGKFILKHSSAALGNGIAAPSGVEIYVSEDGESWGEAIGSATPANGNTGANEATVITANATGRYVQFRFTSTEWTFLSEVEVYAAGADVDGDASEDASEEISEDASEEISEDASEDASEEDTEPGDASSMLVFALIAIIALAGSAVLVKNRK